MEQLLKMFLLFLIPVSAHSDIVVFNGNPIDIVWEEYGEEYEYMVEIYQYMGEGEVLFYTSEWVLENGMQVEIEDEGSYIWRVYIKEVGKICEDDLQCFNVETGYFDFYIPQPILPDPSPTIVKEKDEVVELVPPDVEVLGVTTKYIAKEDFKPKEEDTEEKEEELQEGNECRYIYILSKNGSKWSKYSKKNANFALL